MSTREPCRWLDDRSSSVSELMLQRATPLGRTTLLRVPEPLTGFWFGLPHSTVKARWLGIRCSLGCFYTNAAETPVFGLYVSVLPDGLLRKR